MNSREQKHLQAAAEMRSGNYAAAAVQLTSLLEQEGNHIFPLTDLAACYYVTNDFHKMNQTLQIALEQYHNVREILSPDTRVRSLWVLGKLLEEKGQVAEALEFYQEALSLPKLTQDMEIRLRAQRLRLNSVLGFGDQGGDYLLCLTSFQSGTDFQAELEHALILSEANLFGAQSAWERWKISKPHQHHTSDASLFFYDLCEAAFYSRQAEKEWFQEFSELAPEPIDLFERILHGWLKGPRQYTSENYIEYSRNLSPFSHLRLLSVALKNGFTSSTVTKDHLRVAMGAVSEKNRKRLMYRSQDILQEQMNPSFHLALCQVRSQDKFLQLEHLGLEARIMKLAARGMELSIDEVLSTLYQEEFSDLAWNRLRVAIHRLDKKISRFLGVQKVLRLTKTQLIFVQKFDTSM